MALFCLLCFDLTVYNQINSEILSYNIFSITLWIDLTHVFVIYEFVKVY